MASQNILQYPSGLSRNVRQCLTDFNILLFLNHTVTDIQGNKWINKVVMKDYSFLDKNKQIAVRVSDRFEKPIFLYKLIHIRQDSVIS
jgi:NRPS condensation-like uncharacterized protein